MKKDWRGAGPSSQFVPGRLNSPPKNIGYRQDSLSGETHLFKNIEAFHLCMDIYMHESPRRFNFFINMLIKQVQTLQDTNMDSRDYII